MRFYFDLKNKIIMTVMATGLSLSALSGCSLDHPSTVKMDRVEVEESRYVKNMAYQDIDPSMLAHMARHHDRYGNGPLKVTVQYDPTSKTNTAMKATQTAASLRNQLTKSGAAQIDAEILPVTGLGNAPKVLFEYNQLTSRAPKGCGTMPGLDNQHVDLQAGMSYGLGCTIEGQIARQIARPADLMGRAALPAESDARPHSNVVEQARRGAMYEPLEGEQASDE